jgi:nucleoside-diphosphate-sugar epimerase
MQAAFVTGGSGFIGGALVRRLVADVWRVRALARSDSSAHVVADRGAEAVRGDLDDVAAMSAGMRGCDVAFHCAATLGDWGDRAAFEHGNVQGTRNVLEAARLAGVGRVVHVGTEAALLAGDPLVMVDETAPLRPDSPALYSSTKAKAEQEVIAAAGDELEALVVRPRLVWGVGDTTILPVIVEMVNSGRFAWIAGGRHMTSTTHVDNVIEGLVLAAEKGSSGAAYFVTDGEPVEFREFITRLLATQGVEAPKRSMPRGLARAVAGGGERLWSLVPLPGQPPVTRLAYWLSALETTIDISRARNELGYQPVTTIDAGMEELAERHASAPA